MCTYLLNPAVEKIYMNNNTFLDSTARRGFGELSPAVWTESSKQFVLVWIKQVKKRYLFERRKFCSVWMKIYFLVKTDGSDSEIWSKSCRRRTGRSESSIKQIRVRTAQREIIQLAPVFFLHWDNMTSKQPRTLHSNWQKKKKKEERRGLFFLVWGVVKQQRSTAWTAGKKRKVVNKKKQMRKNTWTSLQKRLEATFNASPP